MNGESENGILFKNVSANSNLPQVILCQAEHYKNITIIELTTSTETPFLFHEKKKKRLFLESDGT